MCFAHNIVFSCFHNVFRFRIKSFDRNLITFVQVLISRDFVTTKSSSSWHTTILWHCLLPCTMSLRSLFISFTTRAPSSVKKSRGGHKCDFKIYKCSDNFRDLIRCTRLLKLNYPPPSLFYHYDVRQSFCVFVF